MVVSRSGLDTACLTASNGLVVSLGLSDTDMSDALVRHNGLDIGKVQIDQARNVNQICDSLNGLLKHLVCLL